MGAGYLEATGGDSVQEGRKVHADALRLQLATLRQKEASQSAHSRSQCEAYLSRAVQLRQQRRGLEEETAQWSADVQKTRGAQAVETSMRSERHAQLSEELVVARATLDDSRNRLKRYEADLEFSESDDDRDDDYGGGVDGLRKRAKKYEEEQEEYKEATSAAEELSTRLVEREEELKEEVRQLRAVQKEVNVQALKKVPPEEVARLRGDVEVLAARVALVDQECGVEAKRLWLTSDTELPRLRAAEAERRRLQQMLLQARFDRDNTESSYDRIINGLQEQEAEQEASTRDLEVQLAAARTEGEEMARALDENQERLVEMRRDRWESESFVQHLNSQIARLEDERDKMKLSIKDRPFGQRPALQGLPGAQPNLSKEAQKEATEFLRQDHRRLVDECRVALANDEEEVLAVAQEVDELQHSVIEAEARNAELRSEVNTVAPLLAGKGLIDAEADDGARIQGFGRPSDEGTDLLARLIPKRWD